MAVVEAPYALIEKQAEPGPAESVLSQVNAVFDGAQAAEPRTLVDILDATVRRHPNEPALDDGTRVLTYRALAAEVDTVRRRLAAAGIGAGDRVGVRMPSGDVDLYIAILGVLAAGAAYVPVDADDPDERARLVFSEAGVAAVLEAGRTLEVRGDARPPVVAGRPGLDDDAWIIFTSGSTGKPKGVAVRHRSAAAFADAESRLFLAEEPLGPGDRVLAGLSVAFDASCEEMWLAWRHGACLVAAPRALVRSGVDLGPWLVAQEITAISTVPTLAALWPDDCLDEVRLLIFGGEACPPELAERLVTEGREVWNTYGPTEATVVATAARLDGAGPVRIGLPLDGWELAVVDGAGQLVPMGESGELVIGGVGLARYLDPDKDAEKYAPLPALGWDRAYRSGDLVRAEPEGLLFLGRADEQVKLGGRRIELGEVDAALQALPGVAAAAAAVRTARGGNQILVGYLVLSTGQGEFDRADAVRRLRAALPAALVPLLAVVPALPVRTSGKVDRAALPWPLPGLDADAPARPAADLTATEAWLARLWGEILGAPPASAADDFFTLGGGSLAAAQLVARIRTRHPGISVADLYQYSTLSALAALLDRSAAGHAQDGPRVVEPTPRRAGLVQSAVMAAMYALVGLRWCVALAAFSNILHWYGPHPWAPTLSWWWVLAGWVLLISPAGRLAIAATGARVLLRGVTAGTYPRGGAVHLRLWAAERLAESSGATSLSGIWLTWYARALGVQIGEDVDLHSLPPVTGMLKLGRGCAIGTEVDLSGHWLDGDRLHLGPIRVGAGAVVGTRSVLMPGARVGKRAEIAPGSVVSDVAAAGAVKTGQRWAGVPAVKTGRATRYPGERPVHKPHWTLVYTTTAFVLNLLPLLAALPGVLLIGLAVRGSASLPAALGSALAISPAAALGGLLAYALLVLLGVRGLSLGLRAGRHPLYGRVAWQAWTTERLMDGARTVLFPLYASALTPLWLRALGMKVGRGVEASTVLALPSMTTVGDGAFLADDTMIASYELGGGWLRIDEARIGARAFLGNSGMTAAGRKVPRDGLVGVLSAAPKKAKAGDSYLGMPPMKLPRAVEAGDQSRTFDPPRRLLVARALVESCRIVPVLCSAALALFALGAFAAAAQAWGWWAAALAGALVLPAAGAVACALAIAAKWLLVGRFTTAEHPLWSAFIWRNELADTFVESLAVPWLIGAAGGTPVMNLWLRGLGARIGRGVWCESHWLPEADLVSLGEGASVNRGCVVQTHLFHDRIMRLDEVRIEAGATLGPHGIALPGATLGEGVTIGPASLVMRGESVPANSRWLGNPIEAWLGAD
ncbi:MAG TPA: Pls/PosA family non-ribosomal peptide synthetase [Actinocrinis sp.]|uniref:Pls/PosA family non-ribosomal peptide synthetase n=1 Tax=Actinocrinis sp. TaxID=1920516 RepID=UPI002D61BFD9|nr:Pls/PosA family non-ribosomal peptide synthetase [Actinocrinis sp.]HZU57639.1 Pls/PosA family non-ribosomal peptide synthetase [Actinocrinis sp.]